MKIIAFSGKKRNGKSTVCELIKEELLKRGIATARINFKDPLLEMARIIGWNGEKDEKGRKLLQRLGTDVVRECIDPDYWVKAWKRAVMQGTAGFEVVLSDDVRFDNEARAVHELGGMVVFIETPQQNTEDDRHRSEAGISPDLIDRSFTNISFGLKHLGTIAQAIIYEFIEGEFQDAA